MQDVSSERLVDAARGSSKPRSDLKIRVVAVCQEDQSHVGRGVGQPTDELNPVNSREILIDEDQIDRPLTQEGQRGFSGARTDDSVAFDGQRASDSPLKIRIGLDHQHAATTRSDATLRLVQHSLFGIDCQGLTCECCLEQEANSEKRSRHDLSVRSSRDLSAT